MIQVICKLSFFISSTVFPGVPFEVVDEVEGIVKGENSIEYLVDFSKDLSKRGSMAENPDNYKKIIISKNKCVILKGE